MIVTYQQDGLFSAATVDGLICHLVPRAAAAAAIVGAIEGVDLEQANEWLDSPAEPAVYRATFTAAIAADIEGLSAEVEAIHDSDRADKLNARIDTALTMIAEVHAQQAELLRLEQAAEQRSIAEQEAREAEAKRQRQAKVERQRQIQVEVDRKRDRKAVREGDFVVVTEAEEVYIGGRYKTVRRVVARYPADNVPPEVEALLR